MAEPRLDQGLEYLKAILILVEVESAGKNIDGSRGIFLTRIPLSRKKST